MSRDTRDEALDTIQDIVDFLSVEYELPAEVREYLRIIEALARHRDLSDFLNSADIERLAKIKSAN
jgi:hypothetical protein